MTKCPNCNEKRFSETMVPHAVEVAGRTYAGRLPALRCAGCGETYTEARDLLAFDRETALHLASSGPVSGAGLAFMREAMRLRAKDLAQLLNVTPEHLSRWENGHREIDRNAWLVIGDLLQHPEETRRRLSALEKPRAAKRIIVRPKVSAKGGRG